MSAKQHPDKKTYYLFLQKKCCCKEKTRSTTLCNASVADDAAAFLCFGICLHFFVWRSLNYTPWYHPNFRTANADTQDLLTQGIRRCLVSKSCSAKLLSGELLLYVSVPLSAAEALSSSKTVQNTFPDKRIYINTEI